MDAGDSGGVGPVEVVVEHAAGRPMPSFIHGACAGVALAAVAAHCWLAVTLAPLRDAYRDMGTGGLPLVLRPRWMWGVPIAGFAALVAVMIRRPRSIVPYVVIGVVLVATAIATWHYAYAPLQELSSNIEG